jgi:DNA modification methylase
VKHVAAFERAEIGAVTVGHFDYQERDERGRDWHLMLGDSAERMAELPNHSIDLSIFSPPFQSLFTYSPSERDLGNARSEDEFWRHFAFISAQLRRLMKPGRNVCVHVAQIASMQATDGVIGVKDFRGATIRHFQDAGFTYHGDVTIDKDPQAQAIRTHSKALLFAQLKRDSAWLRPALADYILVFRAPGENEAPIHPDITNNEWIEWARPIWYGIRESDTLQVAPARSEEDERHICPLQLGTIERCIRLWSNPGETVLSPFAGIGSELYQAVKLGRRGVGCELKGEYFRVAVSNLRRAEHEKVQPTLFDLIGAGGA